MRSGGTGRKTKRLERVVYLLRSLSSGEVVDAEGIAEELGVSRRTVFRDLQALRNAGVRIRYDRPEQAYVVADEENESAAALSNSRRAAVIDRCRLRSSDLEELIMLAYVPDIPQTATQRNKASRAARALAETLPARARAKIESVLLSIDSGIPPKDYAASRLSFDRLASAVAGRRAVSLRYLRANTDVIRQIEVYPFRVKLLSDQWVVEGMQISDHRAVRVGLHAIVEVEVSEQPATVVLTDRNVDWSQVDIESV